MKIRTRIKSFVMVAIIGLLLFGCYAGGTEVKPTPGKPPTQQDPSEPTPKPTPEKPATQQETEQQSQE